jgi:CRP/FNR family cyclic AMP-dependent transcriptional regulator
MSFFEVDKFVNFACMITLFEDLSDQELKDVFSNLKAAEFKKGDVIVQQDTEEQRFYILYSGRVKVLNQREDGDEQIFTVLDHGDFFGEMALLEKKPRSATVQAMSSCQLLYLGREEFFVLLERYSPMAIGLLKNFSSRLRSSNQQVSNFAFMSAPNKIANYLARLASQRGVRQDDGSILVDGIPSQQDIGAIIGNSRETVSRMFTQMETAGMIKRLSRKKVILIDESMLQF